MARQKYQKYTYPVHSFVKFVDGDSIHVEVDRGFKDYSVKDVRLEGVDAPEKGSPAGKAVAKFVEMYLRAWYEDGDLMLISTDVDKYGRVLGDFFYVLNDAKVDLKLTEVLLKLGLARRYEGKGDRSWDQKDLDEYLRRAETEINIFEKRRSPA